MGYLEIGHSEGSTATALACPFAETTPHTKEKKHALQRIAGKKNASSVCRAKVFRIFSANCVSMTKWGTTRYSMVQRNRTNRAALGGG
jgi:hypothetical protein